VIHAAKRVEYRARLRRLYHTPVLQVYRALYKHCGVLFLMKIATHASCGIHFHLLFSSVKSARGSVKQQVDKRGVKMNEFVKFIYFVTIILLSIIGSESKQVSVTHLKKVHELI
jgi:hypothetical protein